MSDDTYIETIKGYTFLTGTCSICKSPNVVIRVDSYRKYANPRVISGNHSHDYCAKHSPIDIKAVKAGWMTVLQTPQGS